MDYKLLFKVLRLIIHEYERIAENEDIRQPMSYVLLKTYDLIKQQEGVEPEKDDKRVCAHCNHFNIESLYCNLHNVRIFNYKESTCDDGVRYEEK